MFKLKNIFTALIVLCLTLLAIPSIYASSTQFDNSQFVSDLTSEEISEIELQEKKSDLAVYEEKVELQEDYKNFAGYNFYADEAAFEAELKATYDAMDANTDYSEEQKNDYYNAVIGSDVQPGVLYQFYDLSNQMKTYNENEKIVVDASAALEVINQYGSPKDSVDNLKYLSQLSQELTEISGSFTEINEDSATAEEIQAAKESNILFTSALTAIRSQFDFYSMPKLSMFKRLTHSSVIMNIGMVIAVIVLFAIRFPVIKKQQEYAWNKFRPITLITIPIVAIIFFVFFTWFFTPSYSISQPTYKIYLDGKAATSSDRIYLNEVGTHTISLVAPGTDLTVGATSFNVIVTDDPSITASKEELPQWSYGTDGLTTFETEGNTNAVYQYTDDEFKYVKVGTAIKDTGIIAKDSYEPDEVTLAFDVAYHRDEFVLPVALRLISPSLLFGTLFFMFILMPKPMVKMYLNELYTINKFCGFLSYNMAYRSNARVLIEETLQSLDSCKFAEDFAIIFFEKDRNMTDKIQDISQIYSYKFFEMYLGIVNIIFDEGVSDSTLKSLSIIQQFGDEYYNQADMFFKGKNGAISALMMIIAICVAIPVVVKLKAGLMFFTYLFTAGGYTATIGSYLIWFGLVCNIYNMYKDNKIVRAEGRYV